MYVFIFTSCVDSFTALASFSALWRVPRKKEETKYSKGSTRAKAKVTAAAMPGCVLVGAEAEDDQRSLEVVPMAEEGVSFAEGFSKNKFILYDSDDLFGAVQRVSATGPVVGVCSLRFSEVVCMAGRIGQAVHCRRIHGSHVKHKHNWDALNATQLHG